MQQPSLELLDFLGSFDDGENGWVDPFELLELEDDGLEAAEPQEAEDEK